MLHPILQIDTPADSRPATAPNLFAGYLSRLLQITGSSVSWDPGARVAFVTLFLLWAARMHATWATWGNLSIDSGREMYVPAMLAAGKTLYRDVWYGYGPAAPYVNSVLFRLFGVHLNVLYWAGSLSALGCAVLLFLTGKQLSSWLAGWTAGAVVLVEAFHAWHFSFPLPYSFPSVYGCLTACLFLWLALRASSSTSWAWMLGAGTAAAAALLLKLEFGAACYASLFLLIGARGFQQRSWKYVLRDMAATLPGVVVCIVVARWMVSIGGFEFITGENLASTWPASYLMRTYGKMWLENSGLAITGDALLQAIFRASFFAALILEVYFVFGSKKRDARSIFLQIALFAALLAYFAFSLEWRPLGVLAAMFFPRDMVLYVGAAALFIWWHFFRQPAWTSNRSLGLALLLAFSSLLAIRVLLRMTASGYAIYYNGPAVLAFLLLLRPIIPRSGRSRRLVFQGESLICLACLAVAAIYAIPLTADSSDLVQLKTERGTIRVPSQVANNYRAAIQFMKKEAALGESVLSVPEDTSLYFLSGTECPTRLFFFTPGILAPGKMTDEVIREIERKPVQYLLWSNRTFPDYGVPRFGTDFDRTLGDYLTSHYRRMGPLVPGSDLEWQVNFTLWERMPESARRSWKPSPGVAALSR